VVWWSGGLVVWWSGGLVVWWSGGLVVWRSGGVAVWRCGEGFLSGIHKVYSYLRGYSQVRGEPSLTFVLMLFGPCAGT
jgi:hypothetical protein